VPAYNFADAGTAKESPYIVSKKRRNPLLRSSSWHARHYYAHYKFAKSTNLPELFCTQRPNQKTSTKSELLEHHRKVELPEPCPKSQVIQRHLHSRRSGQISHPTLLATASATVRSFYRVRDVSSKCCWLGVTSSSNFGNFRISCGDA
jgi:hypothetical protein